MAGESFSEFYELLCQMRNDLRRQSQEIQRLRMEMKLEADKISYTLKEAEQATGFSYSTLYSWIDNGKMKASQPGGKKGIKVVTREELLRVISEAELTPAMKVAS
jgi:excisionase family DNA binding protein